MSTARIVGWNVLVQLGSRATQLVLSGLATLVLVRSLGPTTYGEYALILTIISLCGLISEAGVGRIATRDMSCNPDEEPTLLLQAVGLRFALGVVSTVVALTTALVIHSSEAIVFGVALGSLIFFLDALASVGLIFQVRLKMHYDAMAMVLSKCAVSAVVIAAAAFHAPLLVFVAAQVAGSVVMATVAVIFALRLTPMRLKVDPARITKLLRESIPSGVALLVAVVYLKLDGLLLEVFKGSAALGIYSAAYRPVEYFLLAGSVIANPVYPLLSRDFGKDRVSFQRIYQTSFIALIVPAGALAILSLAYAPQLLNLVFGASYAASATPYRVLICVLPLLFCNGWQALALLAANRQTVTMYLDFVGLAVNVTANLLLIPRFGPEGCAIAALLTAIVVSSTGNVAARRIAGVILPNSQLTRIVAATAVCTAPLLWIGPTLWPLTGIAAVGLYLGLLFPLQVLDLGQIRGLLPARSLPVSREISL
ncbi:MAG: oligosaccharide flippase family protein [Chloroflexi bacterium]|nr:oligosaccharide flippase family protein [Chloroflexota bacterium]